MEELMTINNAEIITDISDMNMSDNRFIVANTQSIPYQLLQQEADAAITKKLSEAGNVMDVKVLDHLVICANNSYYSLADEGRL